MPSDDTAEAAAVSGVAHLFGPRRDGRPSSEAGDHVYQIDTGVIAAMLAAAGTAGADPTPAPAPPYVIVTPGGPTVGGLRTPFRRSARRSRGPAISTGTRTLGLGTRRREPARACLTIVSGVVPEA